MLVHSSGHALPRRLGEVCDDAWIVRERGDTMVAVLADGIGSSREGGAAARRAVEMLADYCLTRPRAWSARRALAEFTAQINRHLYSESLELHGSPELACTLSAIVLERGRLFGCNVGDSPVYHWRRGRLQRLSVAHALVDPAMAHVLTRAVGLEPEIEPHFFEAELFDDDLILICSDGVGIALSDERLAELLSRRAAACSIVTTAHAATEENPELQDDTCAIVLDIRERGHAAGSTRQRLEVVGPLRAGERTDGHRLVRPLAANDRVWLAESNAAKRVVLKYPPAEAADNEPLRNAFIREAWNATRLVSPDLVRAWTPEAPTLRCYAMEFVDAPTLRVVQRTGRLSVEDARALAEFLLRVSQFLLRHDLAHGDIKPENILVLREGTTTTFRLLDLGSAAELFSVTSRAGTASYLAPERFRGAAIAERTEIFSIGATLYEALSGNYPYGEVERFQTPRFDPPPRRLTRLNAAVPPWLDSVILRALDPEPERRYQHFSEIAYDLAHPERVAPHHRKDAPLLERNPLLFYKVLCVVLLLANLWLIAQLVNR